MGHYDGQVGVYDLSSKSNKLLFASSVRVHKHVAPVWMVKWQEDDLSKNLNLYTVAADGRLTSWTLMKNEMIDTVCRYCNNGGRGLSFVLIIPRMYWS